MSEWISVDDRLPRTNESVIGCRKGKYVSNVFLNLEGEWLQDGWGPMKKTVFDDVTHWMPLPEPPKE